MKLALLFTGLLALAGAVPSPAQQLSAPALRPVLTHADSVALLHKVFRRSRRGGRFVGLFEGALLPLVIVGAANPNPGVSR